MLDSTALKSLAVKSSSSVPDFFKEELVSCKAGELLAKLLVSNEQKRCNVTVYLGEVMVGLLEWTFPSYASARFLTVTKIEVHPSLLRRGVATLMWDFAKESGFDLLHSSRRSPSGFAWSKAVGGLDLYGALPEDCFTVTDEDYSFVAWSPLP